MIGWGARWGAVALAVTIAGAASAQDRDTSPRDYYPRDNTLSVTERPHPELDPLGLRAGAFLMFPRVTLGLAYDDNIYALPDNGPDDLIATLAADLDVRSTWSRHALAINAGIQRNQYLDRSDQSTTDYHAGADGRLDMGNGFLALSAQTARFTQARSDVDAPNSSVKPIRYDRTIMAADAQQDLGRFRIAGGFGWRRYRFDDAFTAGGQRLDQSFRDRDVTGERLKIDYALSPRIALYVEGALNQRSYDRQPPGVPMRDSHGYTIEAGADFDITNLVRGHVQLGYLSQKGESGLWSAHGLSGRGKVEWFATPLTTVTLEAAHTLEDSAELDTPAYRATSVGGRVDHELLRSLILNATTAVEWDRFEATGQRARRFRAGAGAQYRIGRTIVVEGAFEHLAQTPSGAPGLSRFADNRLMLSLRFQK